MNVLLDTHVLLWFLSASHDKIPRSALEVLEDQDTRAVVSAGVVWEIEIKRALGKLTAPKSLVHLLGHAGIPTLAILAEHAELAGSLPPHHRDPFDRLLIAQSQIEGLPLLTADPAFGLYDVQTVWN